MSPASCGRLRARDELVASVSHELRTPLTSILGYLDLAIDDPDVPAGARRGWRSRSATPSGCWDHRRHPRASSDSGRSVDLTITPVDTDVADVVRAAAESLGEPCGRGRRDAGHVRGRARGRLRGSAAGGQILDNLIVNAIKYNRPGGVVTLGCTTSEDSTWILVRDSGMGMTEAEMSGLFERFYRAQRIRSGARTGTGLGLAISRQLARAHGGDITVRSTPDVGSTFIIRLPATRASAAPAPRVAVPQPQEHESAPAPDEEER